MVSSLQDLSDRMSRGRGTMPSAAELQEMVAAPSTTLLVARDESGGVLGSVSVAVYRLPSGMRAWIEDAVVRRLAGGRGVGKKLILAALEVAAAAGATTAELLVDPQHTNARHMFQGLGFGPYEKSTYQAHLHPDSA